MSAHKLPPKPPGMSEVQYTYALARAVYETAKSVADKRVALLYDALENERENPAFDDLLSAVADKHMKINDEEEVSRFYGLLVESEDVLLEWAELEIRNHVKAHERGEYVLQVFSDPRARKGSAREKLVEICYKFHFEEARNAAR